MADISDITAYLANAAYVAAYPNGTSQPSVAAMDVRIYEGWPQPDQLDLDMAGKVLQGTPPVEVARANGPLSNVSIFPLQGNSAVPYQIEDNTHVIIPPAYGLVVTVVNGVITVTGSPTAGEYLTIVTDNTFAYSRSGASAAAIIASLATDIAVNYPTVSSTSSTLTIPFAFKMIVRQGAVGTLGKVTHRQKQSFMVTVWAPNHRARTLLAAAIDNFLKLTITATMPDTSQAIVCYNRTNVIDDKQVATIYRRDLIYDVEYATVFQFPGYVITTANISIVNAIGTVIATAPAIV
jgi:hypothetical protein